MVILLQWQHSLLVSPSINLVNLVHVVRISIFILILSLFLLGFELVDTSIQGVINLNGVLDIESDGQRRKYFSRVVAQMPTIDDEFMSKHSPMRRVTQSIDKQPAYLIITGGKDAIVDFEQGKKFKNICDTKGTVKIIRNMI